MLERPCRILVDEVHGCHQMLGHDLRVRLVEAPQVTSNLHVEIAGFNVLGQYWFISSGSRASVLARSAGTGTTVVEPTIAIVPTIAGLSSTVTCAGRATSGGLAAGVVTSAGATFGAALAAAAVVAFAATFTV